MIGKCKECGKKLESGQRKYCSVECRNINYAKLRGTGQLKTYICEWCEQPFQHTRKKRYCSKKCRDASYATMPEEPLDTEISKPGPKISLEEVTRLARESGLSYGEYVALNRI